MSQVEYNDKLFKKLVDAIKDTFGFNINETVYMLLDNITLDDAKCFIEKSEDSYYNYYKGTQSLKPIFKKIVCHLDTEGFSNWLLNLLENDSCNENLYINLINNSFKEIDYNNVIDDLTDIFVKIIKNSINKKTIIEKDDINIEDVLDNALFDINNTDIVKSINKKIDGITRISNSRFNEIDDGTISKHYKLVPTFENNEFKYCIKNKDTNNKNLLPFNIEFKFDFNNCTEIQKYNANHLEELIENLDYNNEIIELPPILEAIKSINSKIIPNNFFEFDDKNKMLIFYPKQNIQYFNFTFKIFNKNMNFEL